MKKKVLGIILILLTLLSLAFWEMWGRVNLMYDDVLVLAKTVPKDTVITESMLSKRRVEKANQSALRLEDARSIIGLSTTHTIHEGIELFTEDFIDSKFVCNGVNGNYVLSIPKDWLKSYPQTLKRGDKAIFYCDGRFVLESTVIYVRDGSNQEVDYTFERLESTANVSQIEIIVTKEEALELAELADQGNKFVILYY